MNEFSSTNMRILKKLQRIHNIAGDRPQLDFRHLSLHMQYYSLTVICKNENTNTKLNEKNVRYQRMNDEKTKTCN